MFTSKAIRVILHLHHLRKKLSNELLLICTHEDLLCIPHPLFLVNYFLNKRTPLNFLG